MLSKKKIPKLPHPPKTRDLPASQGMLQLVREELKAEMKTGFHKMESRFKAQDSKFSQIDSKFNSFEARFAQIDSRFDQVDSRFAQVESRFEQVDSRFEQVLSEIARVGILVEEQNSRNRIVLEGLTGLFQRQDRVEAKVDGFEATLQAIGSRAKA